MSFSASQTQSSDVTYKQKWIETYTGKFGYNLTFDRNNYFKPLSWMKNIPLGGGKLSELQLYYTPSSFKTGMNMSEKLTWNETRSGVKSPDNYNFGLNRTMNLDYRFTNSSVSYTHLTLPTIYSV